MKTPREVLLNRHQAVVPKLDALRRKVTERLSTEREEIREDGTCTRLRARMEERAGGGWPARVAPRHGPWRWLTVPWRELIWPCRRIWAGLAAVWIIVLAVNLSLGDRSSAVAHQASAPSPEMMLAFWRQEQFLAELIEPRPPRPAAPPKPALPQPRSQGRAAFPSA
jgi:hypothetical protein